MSAAVELASKISGLTLVAEPWPHAICDDFLPADVFAELVAALPGYGLVNMIGRPKRAGRARLPGRLVDLLEDPVVLDAVQAQFGVAAGGRQVRLGLGWFGQQGLEAHSDRPDKLWNGQVYLAGDPRGTELYDHTGRLAHVVAWRPNRLTCWVPPGKEWLHAAPASAGRYVLLWWILGKEQSN